MYILYVCIYVYIIYIIIYIDIDIDIDIYVCIDMYVYICTINICSPIPGCSEVFNPRSCLSVPSHCQLEIMRTYAYTLRAVLVVFYIVELCMYILNCTLE